MEKAVRDLLFQARRPLDLDTLVLAGVIGVARQANRSPLIRGLSEARFQKLLNEYFLGVILMNNDPGGARNEGDPFTGVVELLLENRTRPCEPSAWLAYAVASAVMGDNDLWQDAGLPSPQHLSEFMRSRFAPLAALNADGTDWKGFLLAIARQPAE